jgi:hypothetical protein
MDHFSAQADAVNGNLLHGQAHNTLQKNMVAGRQLISPPTMAL